MLWRNKYSREWRTVFAWFPANVNGQTVWLRTYKERYVVRDESKCSGCSCGKQCYVLGWWERKIESEQSSSYKSEHILKCTHCTEIYRLDREDAEIAFKAGCAKCCGGELKELKADIAKVQI